MPARWWVVESFVDASRCCLVSPKIRTRLRLRRAPIFQHVHPSFVLYDTYGEIKYVH